MLHKEGVSQSTTQYIINSIPHGLGCKSSARSPKNNENKHPGEKLTQKQCIRIWSTVQANLVEVFEHKRFHIRPQIIHRRSKTEITPISKQQ
jgi:hypothetical protein